MPKELISKNIDTKDLEIIQLMVLGKTNKQISAQIHLPLSTVQRRVRNLHSNGFVISNVQVSYHKFGFKTGLLHVYLKNGNIKKLTNQILALDGITSVEIHIGNSDILGHVIYKHSKDLLDLESAIKNLNGVERVIWSERVYQSPFKIDKISSILNEKEYDEASSEFFKLT
ncbi:MAG TPA: winged helix-turn-helix transcriptional regulator [Candidatus Nitrosocosmicus sp.]|nr:winged helix-turn-helix transcriptional regulator [Candidatus Nitrosocosmicus sp.]